MRCPKCGYISFDHLENCLKCNRDIKETSSSFVGSAYKIAPPAFLKIRNSEEEESLLDPVFTPEEEDNLDTDAYVDEELEILIDEDDRDSEVELGFEEEDEPILESSGEDQDEVEGEIEIEIDLSQFKNEDDAGENLFSDEEMEQGFDLEEDEEPEEEEVTQLSPAMEMDIPEELADISDLAPPAAEPVAEKTAPAPNVDEELLDLELDGLQFDLELDEVKDGGVKKGEMPEEAILALDEIDFSETLAESGQEVEKSSGEMDMDEDLDFDLDLGGLSIHKDI